jgi:hypothetical protein
MFLSLSERFLSGSERFLSGSERFLSGSERFLSLSEMFLSGSNPLCGFELGVCALRKTPEAIAVKRQWLTFGGVKDAGYKRGVLRNAQTPCLYSCLYNPPEFEQLPLCGNCSNSKLKSALRI